MFRLFAILFISFSTFAASPPASDVLKSVRNRVQGLVREGAKPIVLFDLDDTLLLSRSRSLQILREIALSPDFSSEYPRLSKILLEVKQEELHYELSDNLEEWGFHDSELHKKLQDMWGERFFSNRYVTLDNEIAGAPDYVMELNRIGATVVYLTGRDIPRMQMGTIASLERRGFPMTENTILFMKPSQQVSDLEFKKDLFQIIRSLGTVAAAFENEPANLNAMDDAFPDAEMVFVDTIHSKKPDVPNLGIPWIKNFLGAIGR